MPDKFVIEGGKKLAGEIEVRGSKNAAGAVLAATLLTNEECIIDQVPLVADILNLIEIIKGMGKEVNWLSERKVSIKGNNFDPVKMDFERASKSRVSVLLIGALLPRFKELKIARPGGDRIGLRPITTHLRALKQLGIEVEETNGFYCFKSHNLRGAEITLSEFSVTATENIMMAASLTTGNTLVKLAAQEPHVQNLGEMLKKMGANVSGLDTHTLRIQGVGELSGCEHTIIPDPIEAGTFITLAAATNSNVRINNVMPCHLDFFFSKLEDIGVNFKINSDSVEVKSTESLKATRVQALPYPGFPTDLLPLVVPLLTQAKGKSLIHDPLYENRLNYTQELRKMGADIEIVDPHRAFVFGKTPLHASRIESWDIRAGASLLVAGLMAQGTTTLENISQIDRGYEQIETRLQQIGAQIKRVS